MAVCSQIHTKHINTAVWAERRIFIRLRKIDINSDYYLGPVYSPNYLAVRIEPLGSHWADFYEI